MKEEFLEMPDDENKVILYTTDDGKSQVSLMSRDEGVAQPKADGGAVRRFKTEYFDAYIENFCRERT